MRFRNHQFSIYKIHWISDSRVWCQHSCDALRIMCVVCCKSGFREKTHLIYLTWNADRAATRTNDATVAPIKWCECARLALWPFVCEHIFGLCSVCRWMLRQYFLFRVIAIVAIYKTRRVLKVVGGLWTIKAIQMYHFDCWGIKNWVDT